MISYYPGLIKGAFGLAKGKGARSRGSSSLGLLRCPGQQENDVAVVDDAGGQGLLIFER